MHRDHHIEVARALYSIPGSLIGARVEVRADRELVRVFHRGVLVKIHPRQAAGGRITDADDLPTHKTAYAMRDLDHLRRLAAAEGSAIGAYADALLDTPLPWTKMRQVYALFGLVKRWGPARVEAACARALETEVVSVPLIGRMIERATENQPVPVACCHQDRPPPLASPGTQATSPPRKPATTRQIPNNRPSGWKAVWHDRPRPGHHLQLKTLLRAVKLGRCLDTLPERLALARILSGGRYRYRAAGVGATRGEAFSLRVMSAWM